MLVRVELFCLQFYFETHHANFATKLIVNKGAVGITFAL